MTIISSGKGWLRAFTPYLFLSIAAGLIAPVFLRGLPCSHDTLGHFYRVVQLDVNIQSGTPFLHWGPEMMRGYGYPVLGLYAPLTYWLVWVPYRLGLNLDLAFRLIFWLALVGAACGMYHLARRWLLPGGAIVAALAYLFAPYILFDAIQRGALPETLGLAELPWMLAALDRAITHRTLYTTLTATISLALVVLTHNVIGLVGIVLGSGLAVFSLADAVLTWRAALATGIIALALALSAFFWLPALAEVRDTASARPVLPQPPLGIWPRFDQHILPISSLLQWPPESSDDHLINPLVPTTMGYGPMILAALGFFRLIRPMAARWRKPFLWFGFVTLGMLFLASELSWLLWVNTPPLRFLQLPSRFLGPASLGAALLAGLAPGDPNPAANRQSPTIKYSIFQPSFIFFFLSAIVISVSGWPWLYPRYCSAPEHPDSLTLVQSTKWYRESDETRYAFFKAEGTAELLPRWVEHLPPEDTLASQYAAGGPVNRLRLSGDVKQIAWEHGRAWDRYTLHLSKPASLVYQAFYFPGWYARLDGQPYTPHITEPEGLMAFDIPAGSHTLEIAFRLTPLRIAALTISSLTALILLGVATASRSSRPSTTSTEPVPLTPFAFVVATLFILKFAVIDRIDSPIRADRFRHGVLAGLRYPASVDFSGEVRYLGYDAPREVKSGSTFRLNQYWTALHPLGVPYAFTVRLADDAGHVWSTYEHFPGEPGPPGTESWLVGDYARDPYLIRLLYGTPPGNYWIEVNAFREDTDLALVPAPGTLTSVNPAFARVGQIHVTLGGGSPEAESPQGDTFSNIPVAPGLTLIGFSTPPRLTSGETASITLIWSAPDRPPDRDLTAALVLLDSNYHPATELSFTIGGRYPTSQWPANAVVRDQLRWRIPPALSSGTYLLRLQVQGQATAARLNPLVITAPERTFQSPPVANRIDFGFQVANLTGFTLSPASPQPGGTLNLRLVWEVLLETDISYRVFIHLRDSAGAIRAQSDSDPADWTRPTTGWLPGEYITDDHTLSLPPHLPTGDYHLFVGLYNPADGTRLDEVVIWKWHQP